MLVTSLSDPFALRIDGANSPTSNIDWGGFDITNMGNITGSDVDIDAGTGDYLSSGTGRFDGGLGVGLAPSYPLDIILGATDLRGINVSGISNDLTTSGVNYIFKLDRDYNFGSGDLENTYGNRIDMTMKHTNGNLANTETFVLGTDARVFNTGKMTNTTASTKNFIWWSYNLEVNDDGTYDTTSTGNQSVTQHGVQVKIDNDSTFTNTGGQGNIRLLNTKALSVVSMVTPTGAGVLDSVINSGLHIAMTGNTVSSSINYGIFLSTITGCDKNYGIWDASGNDWVLDGDNQKILFGEGQDASIYYDGTNLIIDPAEVGTGSLSIQSGLVMTIATKTNDYTLTTTDYIILLDGTSNTVEGLLPASPQQGQVYYISCIDATFACTIGRNGKNINGVAADLTLVLDETVELVYDTTYHWKTL